MVRENDTLKKAIEQNAELDEQINKEFESTLNDGLEDEPYVGQQVDVPDGVYIRGDMEPEKKA